MDGATGAGTPELEVGLLGPIQALRAGAPVALGGPKPRALLAVLALEPERVVSVDQLVEALWPGEPPDTAAHAVQVYVSQLRKALGPVIETRPPGYALELAAERVDVHHFARLTQDGRASLAAGDPVSAEVAMREALALWRGPALADFLYEPFAQTEIARLEDLRTVVLEERIDADLALGRHAELVSELEALVQAHPLRERPRRQLMLALYRSGRQADALAAYRAAREALVEQLGIDPGPELRELESAILRQDDSLLIEETPHAMPTMQFRRLVTILFVDVVESLGLAAALDPEAHMVVLRRYFETASAALTRHGGTVEKFVGDAVMAAFGIPVSHEDDALRAARAALDIRAGVAALNEDLVRQHGLGLEIRIGLETGEVVATPTDARQRLVTGETVGITAKLEAAATANEIVVGEVAARLIDHAARLEPLGELEIKGLSRRVRAFRLLELEAAAPAFSRSLDAPLVGRKRQLAALRRSLKRAAEGSSARVAVVVAPAGVGKSRLAVEFTRRAKGVTTLWGRCLSYGDGITYWPLREVLAAAEASEERDAVLSALESDTPPEAPEVALLFRNFCEARARERPLVLVFDDVHWAEPTFLELVEHLAERGEGPILVVCLAREELDETRPVFLAGTAQRIELDALSADETDALVEGLGGAVLESDQRGRIVEAAEGNPLFLEQLLALSLEGGLAERAFPETIQALLAARLDRLGPGERAVLERGAVVGKEFAAEDVVALLEPDAVATADAHLAALADRGFVRPRGDGGFGFRHVLVQDAVYRSAPKRLRAELHERYADRLDTESPALPDLDEFVGYHLEQAYRLRMELGESDRRTRRLAEEGGERLMTAGVRALRRGDTHATSSLMRRALAFDALSPANECNALNELGIVLRAIGDLDDALEVFDRAVRVASLAGDKTGELRARMEREYVLTTLRSTTADALLEAVTVALPHFAATGEDRLVGRGLLLAGWVYGGHRGQSERRLEAAERALVHYQRAAWSIATAAGEIANALYFGPTPVSEAITRCEQLLAMEGLDRFGHANLESYLGGLVAQTGDLRRGRALLTQATAGFEELGQLTSAALFGRAIAGETYLLAGEGEAAVEELRRACAALEHSHAFSHLASTAGALAGALYAIDDLDEAYAWTALAERLAATDDVDALVLWMPVRALIQARRENVEEAVALGLEAVEVASTTDALNRHADAARSLGDVYALIGRRADARRSYGMALDLYEAKGNVVGTARIRALLDPSAIPVNA